VELRTNLADNTGVCESVWTRVIGDYVASGAAVRTDWYVRKGELDIGFFAYGGGGHSWQIGPYNTG